MTVNTRVIKLFLRRQDLSYVPLQDGLRLQILPDVTHLPRCQKHHFAAFINDTASLVVWDDEPRNLFKRAQHIQQQLMDMIWQEDSPYHTEKPLGKNSQGVSVTDFGVDSEHADNSQEDLTEKPRRTVLIQPILTGITLFLIIAALGSGWRHLAIELLVDKSWLRLAFLLVVPLQIWLGLVRAKDLSCQVLALMCLTTVFHAINRGLYRSDAGTYQPDDREHQILLRHRPSTYQIWYPASCHDSIACV